MLSMNTNVDRGEYLKLSQSIYASRIEPLYHHMLYFFGLILTAEGAILLSQLISLSLLLTVSKSQKLGWPSILIYSSVFGIFQYYFGTSIRMCFGCMLLLYLYITHPRLFLFLGWLVVLGVHMGLLIFYFFGVLRIVVLKNIIRRRVSILIGIIAFIVGINVGFLAVAIAEVIGISPWLIGYTQHRSGIENGFFSNNIVSSIILVIISYLYHRKFTWEAVAAIFVLSLCFSLMSPNLSKVLLPLQILLFFDFIRFWRQLFSSAKELGYFIALVLNSVSILFGGTRWGVF